jgi:hypothetical protein
MKKSLLVIFLLISGGDFNLYANPSSFTNQTNPDNNPIKFNTVPIEQWIGQKVIIQPLEPYMAEYGYLTLFKKTGILRKCDSTYGNKIAKITGITQDNSLKIKKLEMVLEGTGEELYGMIMNDTVENLIYLPELEQARRIFVGKTVYCLRGFIKSKQNNSGETSFPYISPFQPLVVSEIGPSSDISESYRFHFTINGKNVGFIDLNISGTNKRPQFKTYNLVDSALTFMKPVEESAEEKKRSFRPAQDRLLLEKEGKDVLGWQKCWWLMKEDELKLTVGESLTKTSQRLTFSQSYCDYEIFPYKIGQEKFRVRFLMDIFTDRLIHIQIRHELPEDRKVDDIQTFKEIESLLLEKYGPFKTQLNEQDGKFYRKERTWLFPSTKIQLFCSFDRFGGNGVVIIYTPAAKSDSNKL